MPNTLMTSDLMTQFVPVAEGQILPRSTFLNRLRMEKRRVDRSRLPLSMALFFFHHRDSTNGPSIPEFLEFVVKNTRETDIKGWVDQDVIGVIFPDTNNQGAKRCIEKITDGNGRGTYSV